MDENDSEKDSHDGIPEEPEGEDVDRLAEEMEAEANAERERFGVPTPAECPVPQAAPAQPTREQKALRRTTRAPEPFPVEALGPSLAECVNALVEISKAPREACALMILSVANFCIQALADLHLPHGVRPTTLFVLAVLPSGERKTALLNHCLGGVRAVEATLRAEYELARRNTPKGEPFDMPEPVMVVGEATTDGLMKLAAKSRGSILLATDEGALFTNAHGMHSKDMMRTCAAFSGLWDATALLMARAATDSRSVVGKRVAIALMAQHEAVLEFLSNQQARAQGILARFLIVMPDSLIGTRRYAVPSEEAVATMARFNERTTQLLRIPLPLEAGSTNVLTPRWISVSREAFPHYVAYHDLVEDASGEGGTYAPIREHAAKSAEMALRIAATQALFADPEAREIGPEEMANGVTLARYFLNEALRIASAEGDPDLLLAEKTLAWIQRTNKPVVALSALYRGGPVEIRKAAVARKIATLLLEHGYLSVIEGGAQIDGKVCEAYQVL